MGEVEFVGISLKEHASRHGAQVEKVEIGYGEMKPVRPVDQANPSLRESFPKPVQDLERKRAWELLLRTGRNRTKEWAAVVYRAILGV